MGGRRDGVIQRRLKGGEVEGGRADGGSGYMKLGMATVGMCMRGTNDTRDIQRSTNTRNTDVITCKDTVKMLRKMQCNKI
ncbi:hypothetical protein E2C01_061002 [Portunus trituberculatus]|uniref:Uncharacterized protein n=1 Tax=Portunus trituberculatus TaxID=210409 RepID=A0A5B7HC15_PORTR|nr:hypothetical protein [Portunus trituberculatus]